LFSDWGLLPLLMPLVLPPLAVALVGVVGMGPGSLKLLSLVTERMPLTLHLLFVSSCFTSSSNMRSASSFHSLLSLSIF
jgi:hypothetical protein